jgi:hypothetical protein
MIHFENRKMVKEKEAINYTKEKKKTQTYFKATMPAIVSVIFQVKSNKNMGPF